MYLISFLLFTRFNVCTVYACMCTQVCMLTVLLCDTFSRYTFSLTDGMSTVEAI